MNEETRLLEMYRFEDEFYKKGKRHIAGCDEAGRGPLAGPVVAAAVILPHRCLIVSLDDSKKLSEKKRLLLEQEIKETAIAWSVARVEAEEIDRINILEASRKAMLMAVEQLSVPADAILIDGPYGLHQETIPQKAVKKGDSLSASIAAASILAKNHRDRIMVNYDSVYPQYGFVKHKGYPTKYHREMIHRYGLSPIHRRTFTVK